MKLPGDAERFVFESELRMSRSIRASFILLIVAAFARGIVGQVGMHQFNAWPTYFYPDDKNRGFEHAQPPIEAVFKALLLQPEVKETYENLSAAEQANVKHLFEAVQIDLSKSGEQSYIVQGDFPMSGGDCVWFWIVRVRQGKAEVLLHVLGASVRLRKHHTQGYRDVVLHWSVGGRWGDRTYRYDGSTYKLIHEHSHEGAI